jgi:hypothetical protein
LFLLYTTPSWELYEGLAGSMFIAVILGVSLKERMTVRPLPIVTLARLSQ